MESANNLFSQGVLCAKRGEMLEAAEYFKAAIAENPNVVPYHINLGNVYQRLGDLDKAKRHLLQALRLDPQHAEGYNNLGCLFYKQGLFQKATPYFQKALRINPNYWEAHYNLAHSFAKQNLLSSASVHYREVIRLQQDHPIADYHLGLIYFEERYFPKALEHLSKVVDSDPSHGFAWYYLAHSYLVMGDCEMAKVAFEKALDLLPTPDMQGEIHHNLAVLSLKQKNHQEALFRFKQSLNLQPHNETARHMITAMQGSQTTTGAPPAYIADLFDQYANYYNEQVKEKLQYVVPGLLRNAVAQCKDALHTGRVLDLGCGTGLCGIYCRDLALDLVGVDLSPKMIEKARELGAYDSLYVMDITEYLSQPDLLPFDLIIAGDVLVYLGDLSDLFQKVSRALKPDGHFAFTTEDLEEGQYFLQTSGRFSHNASYIHTLAQQQGFTVELEESIVPRISPGEKIKGRLFVLKKIS